MEKNSFEELGDIENGCIKTMSEAELYQLERDIRVRYLDLAAMKLQKLGFNAINRNEHFIFPYVMVRIGEEIGVWADIEDCQRLVDTTKNMPGRELEAFKRWRDKIEPLELPEISNHDWKLSEAFIRRIDADPTANPAEIMRSVYNG